MLALTICAIMIPIGFLAYEALLARAQYNQLQAANDATALAAAAFVSKVENAEETETAQNIGLHYFQKNKVHLSSLSGATLSDDAFQDKPEAGKSTVSISVDKTAKTVTVKSAFGLEASFLKIGVFPIHVISVAGPGKKDFSGDVCFVVDLSWSMILGTDRTAAGSRVWGYARRFVSAKRTTTTFSTTTTSEYNKDGSLKGTPVSTSTTPVTSAPETVAYTGTTVDTVGPTTGPTSSPPNTIHEDGSFTSTATTTTVTQVTQPAYVYYTYSGRGRATALALHASWSPRGPKNICVPRPGSVYYPGPIPASDPISEYITPGSPQPVIDAKTPKMLAVMQQCDSSWDAFSPKPYCPALRRAFASKDEFRAAVLEALLIESKRGNLETLETYGNAQERADKTALRFVTGFTPGRGYQLEYQRIALTFMEPRYDTTRMVRTFIEHAQSQGWDVHWSLIGYGYRVPNGANGKSVGPTQPDDGNVFHEATQLSDLVAGTISPGVYETPEVMLSPDSDNSEEVLDTLDMATLSGGTSTAHALREARAMFKGSRHRKGKPKTIILLTDGQPTDKVTGGKIDPSQSYQQAKAIGKEGIRLVTAGLFECAAVGPSGRKYVNTMALKAKNGAQSRSFGENKVGAVTQGDLKAMANDVENWLEKVVSTPEEGITLR